MTRQVYRNVFHAVALIPKGRVASYGQIASMVDGCTARMVGYAMSAIPGGIVLPWQRVVNSQGKVSNRGDREGMATFDHRALGAMSATAPEGRGSPKEAGTGVGTGRTNP